MIYHKFTFYWTPKNTHRRKTISRLYLWEIPQNQTLPMESPQRRETQTKNIISVIPNTSSPSVLCRDFLLSCKNKIKLHSFFSDEYKINFFFSVWPSSLIKLKDTLNPLLLFQVLPKAFVQYNHRHFVSSRNQS